MENGVGEELHPVVKLLLARYASDPEEFLDRGNPRYQEWWAIIEGLAELAYGDDLTAIKELTYGIRMDKLHARAVRAVLNPEGARFDNKLSPADFRRIVEPTMNELFDTQYSITRGTS
jgi:hypothetical protein